MPAPIELDPLRVVLVSSRNPLNIGAAARAMSNFGFSCLRVVNPYEKAFRQAVSAVGAGELLASAEEYENVADAVADCTLVVGTTAVRHRELQHPLRRLEYGGRLIRKHMASGPVALLFGSERCGLSKQDLSYCHWLIRIPTQEQNISMNLGQAVAICLYELIRDGRTAARTEKQELASGQEIERITTLLADVLSTSSYMLPQRAAETEQRIRRMVRRIKLSARDVEAWLGILRHIQWQMRSGKKKSE
ncbi:MAG: RNA methyltransferase [Terriglobales bacterium]